MHPSWHSTSSQTIQYAAFRPIPHIKVTSTARQNINTSSCKSWISRPQSLPSATNTSPLTLKAIANYPLDDQLRLRKLYLGYIYPLTALTLTHNRLLCRLLILHFSWNNTIWITLSALQQIISEVILCLPVQCIPQCCLVEQFPRICNQSVQFVIVSVRYSSPINILNWRHTAPDVLITDAPAACPNASDTIAYHYLLSRKYISSLQNTFTTYSTIPTTTQLHE